MSLKGRSCRVVRIRTVRSEELSLEPMGRFVPASEEIRFEAAGRQQRNGRAEPSRQCCNGLVEAKNRAIIRKHSGMRRSAPGAAATD